jgi:hypothetical protein
MAVNLFALSGKIAKVSLLTKGERKSAVVILQYGDEREHSSSNPFVNAVPVRIPHYKYDKVEHMLKEGQSIDVTGHLQGVFKDGMGVGNGFFNTELVADRVETSGIVGAPANGE